MNLEILEKLLNTSSPSGYEEDATEVFNSFCSGFLKKEFEDKMGNSCWKLGSGSADNKKIMISAHIDEIGLQVQNITSEGMLNVVSLGGIDRKTLYGSTVTIKSERSGNVTGIIGKTPIHIDYRDKNDSDYWSDLDEFLVDIGADSKEEAEKLVSIGDTATFSCNSIMKFGENKVLSKGLDDKIGIFIVMEVAKKLSELSPVDLKGNSIYIVSNTQEEVGLRGAKVTSKRISPDYSIDVDVTFSTDEGRGIKKEVYGDIELGKGPVIAIGPDKSKNLIKLIKEASDKSGIKYQLSVESCGGTNTSAIQLGSEDCEAALISIPNRNMHTQVEMCDYRDIEGAINMITESIKALLSK